MRMQIVEWLSVATTALDAAQREGDPAAQTAMHLSLAQMHRTQARYQQAIDHYNSALPLAEQAGWLEGQSAALGGLGTVYSESETSQVLAATHRDIGNHATALKLAQTATTIAREIGERRVHANALIVLASVQQRLGNTQQAISGHQQALDLARAIDDQRIETDALIGLAEAHQQAGQLDTAAEAGLVYLEIGHCPGHDRAYDITEKAQRHLARQESR